jgi:hypothetical protein
MINHFIVDENHFIVDENHLTVDDKRWDENDKKWDENDKKWDENDKKWDEIILYYYEVLLLLLYNLKSFILHSLFTCLHSSFIHFVALSKLRFFIDQQSPDQLSYFVNVIHHQMGHSHQTDPLFPSTTPTTARSITSLIQYVKCLKAWFYDYLDSSEIRIK